MSLPSPNKVLQAARAVALTTPVPDTYGGTSISVLVDAIHEYDEELSKMNENLVAEVITDLMDFLAELDDREEAADRFGEWPRVSVEGSNTIIVRHEEDDSRALRITVEAL